MRNWRLGNRQIPGSFWASSFGRHGCLPSWDSPVEWARPATAARSSLTERPTIATIEGRDKASWDAQFRHSCSWVSDRNTSARAFPSNSFALSKYSRLFSITHHMSRSEPFLLKCKYCPAYWPNDQVTSQLAKSATVHSVTWQFHLYSLFAINLDTIRHYWALRYCIMECARWGACEEFGQAKIPNRQRNRHNDLYPTHSIT